MKNRYTTPVFLNANGTITLTVSQAAALGLSEPAKWEEFWEEAKDSCIYEDFDVNIESTWPAGFSLADPDSWFILLFGED